MDDTRVSQVTAILISAAMGAFVGFINWKHLILPPNVQATVTLAVTFLAGAVAPSVVEFASRWRPVISIVLTLVASIANFALANATGVSFQVAAIIGGMITFLTGLLLPSTSHPSSLTPVPPRQTG